MSTNNGTILEVNLPLAKRILFMFLNTTKFKYKNHERPDYSMHTFFIVKTAEKKRFKNALFSTTIYYETIYES